jgi:hypothetical protein
MRIFHVRGLHEELGAVAPLLSLSSSTEIAAVPGKSSK